jgi:hypothetical protein
MGLCGVRCLADEVERYEIVRLKKWDENVKMG